MILRNARSRKVNCRRQIGYNDYALYQNLCRQSEQAVSGIIRRLGLEIAFKNLRPIHQLLCK